MKYLKATSYVGPDGAIVEMISRPDEGKTLFAVHRNKKTEYVQEYRIRDELTLQPIAPNSDLVRSRVILFPSEAADYGSDQELIEKIRAFIHRYVQVSTHFEKLACYYVLFTWVHDRFNELPYLRVLGDSGKGKTRFLKVVGPLCYKPISVNGATSASPIFRIIELARGTLILNESDFYKTEIESDMTKILNNGFEKGLPVLRSEARGNSFEVKSFNVFGPKILGGRKRFDDNALESRLLTEMMDFDPLRDDIPINLPLNIDTEALELRNRLLKWRFMNYHETRLDPSLADRDIEPRFNQIMIPLCSVISDQSVIKDIKALVREIYAQTIEERGMTLEAEVLRTLLKMKHETGTDPTVKDICQGFYTAQEDAEFIKPRRMGYLLQHKLGLKTERTRRGSVLHYRDNADKIESLKRKYGFSNAIKAGEAPQRTDPSVPESSVGATGDVHNDHDIHGSDSES